MQEPKSLEEAIRALSGKLRRKNDCLIWSGAMSNGGRLPVVKITYQDERGLKIRPLRRVLCGLAIGHEPTGRVIAGCGNYRCVSPQCAQQASLAATLRTASAKRLSPEQRRALRDRAMAIGLHVGRRPGDSASFARIAAETGVHPSAVARHARPKPGEYPVRITSVFDLGAAHVAAHHGGAR